MSLSEQGKRGPALPDAEAGRARGRAAHANQCRRQLVRGVETEGEVGFLAG